MNRNQRTLLFRMTGLTLFIPMLIVLLTNFTGENVEYAINNSLSVLFDLPESIPVWVVLLLLCFVTHLYLKPIVKFFAKNSSGIEVSMTEKNSAMKAFNRISYMIPILTALGFVIINFIMWFDSSGVVMSQPFTYKLMESVFSGLFTSAILIMSLENILYPTKCALMVEPPDIKPKFRSLYGKLAFIVILLLVFLSFQILSIASEFYLIAYNRASELFMVEPNYDIVVNPEMFFSQLINGHKQTGDIMQVFISKIFIYFLISIRLLALIKKLIKNPIKTVENRLEKLTSEQDAKQQQIDIVNNDEFGIIYRDINRLINRKQSQLENSKDRLHAVIDNAADPIISFDENGQIYMFNPAAESLFGWSREEARRMQFSMLFDQSQDYCKVCGEDSRKFVGIVTDKENKLQRFEAQKKDGTKISVESNFSDSPTPEGIIYTAIIRDISKQLEFEESLKKAKLSAERANELKSEFLANMSHELRTPLNAVLGFTQLLHTDKNLTDSQVDKLNIISRSGEHLLGLINDILDISKIEAGKIELHDSSFNLRDFTEDLKQMMDLKCKKKGLALYVEYVEPLPLVVKTDLGKLRQIMINIIGNAVKFTKEGGISIVVGVNNGKLRFSVNDTGKGIPESEIKSILQPFNQSSITDHEGGTGLGLAITNSFISMMGGEFEIESEENVGSTFSFEVDFELSEDLEEKEEDLGTVIGIQGDRHPKVIIVDDKINNRLILKEILEKVGFVTIEAENGLEAIERTKEFKPELVFMDIKMPIMDGYEAVKQIKSDETIKDIPVFALTASAFKHDEKSILSSGFDGFIAKPFKMTSLFKLISEISDIEFLYEAKKTVTKKINIDDLDFKQINIDLSKETLDEIDDMALINDFTGIKTILEPLRIEDSLVGFIDSVINFTDNFDDDNLLKLIERVKDAG